ncbi:hypothetical protein LEP1GSC161_2148 [Leptospira santarosai str. CBC1416]|uniref:PF07599 family protein n=3 Tax=Leptospira santarosai TaxID=28183 RepID=M6UIE9_9LEPT|nr:hypothetical protein LEP1GSC179_2259 [Leptospira santarosai str. MOR084]EKO79141.1 hypothetical protein LEP1GSC068_4094 [Leptospira sp. Fiocruz LV3954]EKR90044.1 hypothetical protein LEP1GSC163_1562 [Leptospira santarosai str. CBC379]EKS09324.1 hypothetical protein LEP1GSC071_3730 [Leptospira santarosai str. JET]EMI69779.1 hypothetical protein LEP1GSC076_3357 [Leptospira sp. Fiocruz LV4135]EMJ47432.1 hypothetical protein LEP1GSC169_0526 [Leptospira santarosai str. HAI1349]EMM88562.1 hypoth
MNPFDKERSISDFVFFTEAAFVFVLECVLLFTLEKVLATIRSPKKFPDRRNDLEKVFSANEEYFYF